MTSLLSRIGAFFLEPEEPGGGDPVAAPSRGASAPALHAADASPPERTTPTRWVPPGAAPIAPGVSSPSPAQSPVPAASSAGPDRSAAVPAASPARTTESAAVLGAPTVAIPLAAACAGELRARARAAAALMCIWRPGAPLVAAEPPAPTAQSPAGATTPGAKRLAALLAAHDLGATACGRLAWLALEHDPRAAAEQLRRCLSIAGAPVVLAVAGARPALFEPLLAELDLVIAALPTGIEPALRELALATLHARERVVLPPLPPGPPRWAAMAGLARLRSLPRGAS